MGKTERGGDGQCQAGQDHPDHPCQLWPGRQPAFRLFGTAGEELDQHRVQQPRRQDHHHDDADHHQRHRDDDVATEPGAAQAGHQRSAINR